MPDSQEFAELSREQLEVRLRTAERALRDAEAARLARHAESEALNYSISHDLRAPLRAIRGFSDIVKRRYGAALDEKGRQFLTDVIDSASMLDLMIEDLLRYARLGRRGVVSMPVPVSEIVERVVLELRESIAEANAAVQVSDSLPTVMGDPQLLTEAFRILLRNALTYVSPGRSPSIAVSGRVESGVATIDIRDEGIGIDPAHHERIFNLFQRLHSAEEYPGRGAGLAIARRALALQTGTISVLSRASEGATFRVALPAAAQSVLPSGNLEGNE